MNRYRRSAIDFSLAGVARETGKPREVLDRIIEPGIGFVAYRQVELDGAGGDQALWFSGDTYLAPEGGEVLRDFLRLVDAEDDQFVRFARRYGPTGVCEHGWHELDCPEGCRGRDRRRYSEALSEWRELANDALTVLEMAAALHRSPQGQIRVRSSAWLCWNGQEPFRQDVLEARLRGNKEILLQRGRTAQLVRGAVRSWLGLTQLRIDFNWASSGPEIFLWGHPCFLTSIAQHLLFAVCRVDGLAICDNCGRPFVPRRKPRKDQHTWCFREECERASWRNSKRKRRQAQRGA